VGERWQELADHLAPRVDDQVLPFLDVQYLYGLARAGRPEADALMANIESQTGPVWEGVATPAARGMLAHARGDYATAADELGRVLPRMIEIGGSHAQRDLFTRMNRDARARTQAQIGI